MEHQQWKRAEPSQDCLREPEAEYEGREEGTRQDKTRQTMMSFPKRLVLSICE
jgi:hypothetical protein